MGIFALISMSGCVDAPDSVNPEAATVSVTQTPVSSCESPRVTWTSKPDSRIEIEQWESNSKTQGLVTVHSSGGAGGIAPTADVGDEAVRAAVLADRWVEDQGFVDTRGDGGGLPIPEGDVEEYVGYRSSKQIERTFAVTCGLGVTHEGRFFGRTDPAVGLLDCRLPPTSESAEAARVHCRGGKS